MLFGTASPLDLKVDIHSHLVPGVDDGVRTVDEACRVIEGFIELGYKKLITTPHISEAYYPNSPRKLQESFDRMKTEVRDRGLEIELALGAEYMVDGALLTALKQDDELLLWGGRMLIETTFQALPLIFDEVIFEMQSKNITPVLAHPERYPYFFDKVSQLADIRQRGVQMQITAGSLSGLYGTLPDKMARAMLKAGLVDYIGSDVHRDSHLNYLHKGLKDRALRKKKASAFMNDELAA